MKKMLVYGLLAVMIFSFAGCGKKNNDNNGTQQESGSEPENTADNGTQEGESSSEDTAMVYGKGVSMEDLKAAVVEILGENYWPNTEIPAEMLEGTFGISQDMYEEYFGEMPMISTNVDTMLIVRAKEGQEDAVEEALNTYRDSLVNDTMQYPMNLGKIQASRIEVFGSYICFIQLGGDTVEASESGEEAVIERCQEENEKALDAIEKALVK